MTSRIVFLLSLTTNLLLIFFCTSYWFFHRESTVYSTGYSEALFKQVSCRQNIETIEQLIGKPLFFERLNDKNEVLERVILSNQVTNIAPISSTQPLPSLKESKYRYFYSVPAGSDSYQVRIIEFDEHGTLERKVQELFID